MNDFDLEKGSEPRRERVWMESQRFKPDLWDITFDLVVGIIFVVCIVAFVIMARGVFK
jgi:hypothetical protein